MLFELSPDHLEVVELLLTLTLTGALLALLRLSSLEFSLITKEFSLLILIKLLPCTLVLPLKPLPCSLQPGLPKDGLDVVGVGEAPLGLQGGHSEAGNL